MKIELCNVKPDVFKEDWPDEYKIFSWMEYVCSIPQAMFLITTYKEDRIPNACLHSWATFTGQDHKYYCVMSLLKKTHTYANILRDKCFCINFPQDKYLHNCYATIKNNRYDTDEISSSGFTYEKSFSIDAPRIKECFLNLECKFEWEKELFPGSMWNLICGSVEHLGIDPLYAKSDAKERLKNFGIMYNVHSPQNPLEGSKDDSYVAKLQILEDNV